MDNTHNEMLNRNVNDAHIAIQPNSSNPEKDKFLFYVDTDTLAVDCCCGCSLKTGVQVIALFFITGALSNFFTALQMYSALDIMLSGLLFLLYFAAGVCILYSSMTFNFVYAYTGYIIYAIIFLFTLLDNLILTVMVFAGVYKPQGSENQFITGIFLMTLILVTMSLQLYMIWIIFSFAIHMKNKRIALLSGYIFSKP